MISPSCVFRFINALSLDVAFGAVFCSGILYKTLNIKADENTQLLLGLSVWLIYTLDHLIDSQKIDETGQSFRHLLHKKYFYAISTIWIIILITTGYLTLFKIPSSIIIPGFALLSFIVFHFLANQYLKPNSFFLGKEVRIAFGFTSGIALAPLILSGKIPLEVQLVILFIFLLALINLLVFSISEKEYDQKHNLPGIAQLWLENRIRNYIHFFSILCFLLCILLFSLSSVGLFKISVILLAMLFVLYFSFLKMDKLKKDELYRFVGDGTFLIPIAINWI